MSLLAHIDTRLPALPRLGESNGPSLARSWLGDGSTAYWTADGAESHADSQAAHSVMVRFKHGDLPGPAHGLVSMGYGGSYSYLGLSSAEKTLLTWGPIVTATDASAIDTWHDLVASLSTTACIVWLDGTEVINSGVDPTNADYDKFSIGVVRYSSLFRYFVGNIHEVALYDYALTLADAQALHAAAGVSHAAALTLSGDAPLDDWLLGNAVDVGGGTYTCPSLGSRGITATSVGTISIVEDTP